MEGMDDWRWKAEDRLRKLQEAVNQQARLQLAYEARLVALERLHDDCEPMPPATTAVQNVLDAVRDLVPMPGDPSALLVLESASAIRRLMEARAEWLADE